MGQKKETTNDAMISENNTKKMLRIVESDVAKFVACLAGGSIFGLFGGAVALAGGIACGAGACYYGFKSLFRVLRVAKEDTAIASLEKKAPVVAQKEAERQHNALLKDLQKSSVARQDTPQQQNGTVDHVQGQAVAQPQPVHDGREGR